MAYFAFFFGGFFSALLSLMLSAFLLLIPFQSQKLEILFFVFLEEICKLFFIFLILKLFFRQVGWQKIFPSALLLAAGFSFFEYLLIFWSREAITPLFSYNFAIHFVSALFLVPAGVIFFKKDQKIFYFAIAAFLLFMAIFVHYYYNLFAIPFV